MGDTGSEETLIVKEMYWKGKDFHVITVGDAHLRFINAYCTGFSEEEQSDIIRSEEVVYVAGGEKDD